MRTSLFASALGTRISPRHPLLIAALTAIASILTGCSTIHIHSETGIETRTIFGFVNVHFPETSRSIVTETSGIGLVAGQQRITLGWMKESVVAIRDPSHCQVMFLSATRIEAQAIEKLLRESGHNIESMCVIAKEKT